MGNDTHIIASGEKWVGSGVRSNGLYRNYEVGVLIENSEIAYEMGKLIRRLVE